MNEGKMQLKKHFKMLNANISLSNPASFAT